MPNYISGPSGKMICPTQMACRAIERPNLLYQNHLTNCGADVFTPSAPVHDGLYLSIARPCPSKQQRRKPQGQRKKPTDFGPRFCLGLGIPGRRTAVATNADQHLYNWHSGIPAQTCCRPGVNCVSSAPTAVRTPQQRSIAFCNDVAPLVLGNPGTFAARELCQLCS